MPILDLTTDELAKLRNAVEGFISDTEIADDHLLEEKALLAKLRALEASEDAYLEALVREHELFPMRDHQPPVFNVWRGAGIPDSALRRFLDELETDPHAQAEQEPAPL